MFEIKIICNNIAKNPFLREHGLSLIISNTHQRILFDTGQRSSFETNMNLLHESYHFDAIALSHGHYDHTGGLKVVLPKTQKKIPLFLHPRAYTSRYSKHETELREIGMPEEIKLLLKEKNTILIENKEKIFNHLFFITQIPRLSHFEDTGGDFYLDHLCQKKDFVEDDSCLVLEKEEELFIITGCCHSGLCNTITHVENLFQKKVIGILGGFHMLHASLERTKKTIAFLKNSHIQKIYSFHCTGENFENKCLEENLNLYRGKVGNTIKIF